MADLDLAHGPWKRIVSATWGSYPVQIYQNPEKVLLIALFEKKDDEITGVLVLERRALIAEGDISNFLLQQKREMTLVEKITRESRFKYLILDSTPAFIPYSEAELSNEVAKQYEELDALLKITKRGLESTTEVKARELKSGTEDEIQNLLGDPVSILSFSKKGVLMREMHDGRSPQAAKVILGIDREGQKVEVPLKSIFSSVVLGDGREKRLHILHILAENVLINSMPVVVFDSQNAFAGLTIPNKSKDEFEKFSMKPMPIGFQLKQFELGKGLFVDLSLIGSDLFLSSFSLEKADIAVLVKKVYDEKREKLSVLGDLIAELNAFKETKEFPRFIILRAVRVISVLQKTNPMLFGKNISEELAAPWKDGMGKVIYIPLSKQRDEVKRLIVNAVMKTVTQSPFVPNSVLFVFDTEPSVLKDEILKQLPDFPKNGKGYALQSENEGDMSLFSDPSLRLEVVGNEVILTEKNEPKRRFTIRPAYSTCQEFTTAPSK
ncbi:MAG TPA: hypothetical protein VJI13_04275 [Candidatus Norongarragalinales archaeon]|nr:hypothetical protein [Candidatus Norongarragalinales archaeon]